MVCVSVISVNVNQAGRVKHAVAEILPRRVLRIM